jgi:hypothetical protein
LKEQKVIDNYEAKNEEKDKSDHEEVEKYDQIIESFVQ